MNTPRPNSVNPESSPGADSRHTPADIEDNLSRTRERLDRTLRALQSKLSPARRMRDATDRARQLGRRALRAATTPLTPYITTMIQIDHTHVLALFRRLRPWTSSSRKRVIVANACMALEVHAQLEEEIFYPALRQVLGNRDLLDQSVPEHDRMRELIRVLGDKDVRDADYDETVHALMRTVLHHVADEESTLLPQAEMLLGGGLTDLGTRMTRRRLELLRPNLGSVAVMTARSFPVITAAAAAGVFALGWMLLRQSVRANRG